MLFRYKQDHGFEIPFEKSNEYKYLQGRKFRKLERRMSITDEYGNAKEVVYEKWVEEVEAVPFPNSTI